VPIGLTVIGAGTQHLPPSRIHAPATNPCSGAEQKQMYSTVVLGGMGQVSNTDYVIICIIISMLRFHLESTTRTKHWKCYECANSVLRGLRMWQQMSLYSAHISLVRGTDKVMRELKWRRPVQKLTSLSLAENLTVLVRDLSRLSYLAGYQQKAIQQTNTNRSLWHCEKLQIIHKSWNAQITFSHQLTDYFINFKTQKLTQYSSTFSKHKCHNFPR